MTKVAIISTSWDKLGDTGKPTGSWAEEVMAPFYVFKEAGFEVVVASIKGGEIPFDETSLNPPALTKEAEKFLLDDAAMKHVTESAPLSSLKAADFDALFMSGGHGTCWDFSLNKELGALLVEAFEAGKIVSAVCHGPTGFVSALGKDGSSIIKGRKVTGFTNEEEHAVGLEAVVPFLLEDKLKELGGVYSKIDKWQAYTVVDGNLITGQNPGSSIKTAHAVVDALKAKA